MGRHTLNVEDFIKWATKYEEEYYQLYELYMEEMFEMDADDFIVFLKSDLEESQDLFEDEMLPIIEELETDDYFGTEGFDKRFS